jgi:hypothetical protein
MVMTAAGCLPLDLRARHSPTAARITTRDLYSRRSAKFLQDALAQSLWIAFARFRKLHNLLCDYFIRTVTAIGKLKRHQGHFECDAHDPDHLRVELLAF